MSKVIEGALEAVSKASDAIQSSLEDAANLIVKQSRPASTMSTRPMSSKALTPAMNCLVTGGSGYIAMHVVNLLLKEGHKVTATVRSLANEDKCAPLKKLAKTPENLVLVEADICNADCWKDIVKDMDVVFHVASPFPMVPPADEQEVIKPAVDGTLNVLKACFDTKVKRVVLTGSCVSIFGDMASFETKCYTEADWASEETKDPYTKSKKLAEKAAWDLVEERKKAEQPCFELAVVNPSLVFGPSLSGNKCTSEDFFMMAFNNNEATEPMPNHILPICDVRDVALVHYRAACLAEAVGNRHIIMHDKELVSMGKLREILAEEFNPKGMKIATGPMAELTTVKPTLDNKRMVEVLKVPPTPLKQTLVDMANNMVERGFFKLTNMAEK